MKKLTEQMRQLEAALGYKYTLMYIDEDWCLYRDLGNGYDIEINLKGTRKAKLNASVYVWQVRDQLKVIRGGGTKPYTLCTCISGNQRDS